MDSNNPSDITLDDENKINALMYADDLIIMSDSKEGLQKEMENINAFCTKWKLDINTKRTKIMVLINAHFYINNKIVPFTPTIRANRAIADKIKLSKLHIES